MNPVVKKYLSDISFLYRLPTSARYKSLVLPDYPFDLQLLTHSHLYRRSRKHYLENGGRFAAKTCSMMRGLSAQDLFANEIDYTPCLSEMLWFKDHTTDVFEPIEQMKALVRFNDISVFHEQNHRIIWSLLPPAPKTGRELSRYLNFAESLVVALDLALGDELGKTMSLPFQRMNIIYRPGAHPKWQQLPKLEYRKYLLALTCTTYLALEIIHHDDILNAVNYVLPGQKQINRAAVTRGLEISELFTRVTNPQWQQRYLRSAAGKLSKMHAASSAEPLFIPADPLDLDHELGLATEIFKFFSL